MTNCQGCGAINDDQSLNCVACGRLLAVQCPQCSARNAPSAAFCSNCGRVLSTSQASPASHLKHGEPIMEMLNPFGPAGGEVPPKAAFLKVVIGGFIFGFLFISQALSGYPAVGILAGLASGVVALWGFVELTFWVMERFEQSPGRTPPPSEEAFPAGVAKGFSGVEGSFEEVEHEVSSPPLPPAQTVPAKPSSEKTGSHRRKTKKSETMVTTMVASGPAPDVPAENLPREAPATPTPLPPTVSDSGPRPETPKEEDLVAGFDDLSDLPQRERKSQTLAEFLDEGVTEEINNIQKKIAKSPQNYSLLLKLAQLWEERGETSNAIYTMEKCLAFAPQAPEVYLYHGILLRRSGNVEKAREAFEKCLFYNKFLSKAHYQLGILERGARNLERARESLQRCIQLAPDDAYAHYQLGMVYREMGDFHLAQMELKRACILNPTDSYGHSQLGQIHHHLKKFDLAVMEYSQALSLKPNDHFVLEKLAEVMVEKGEDARAQDLFQEALAHQFHPDPKTMLSLARILHSRGKLKELKTLVDEILRVSPDNPDALFLLAKASIDEKDPEKAMGILLKLSEACPDRSEIWLELGKLFQAQGSDDKAISALIKATNNAADPAGLWNTIGILFSGQKDYVEALRAFKKAAGYDYSDTQIQANLKSVQRKIESTCRSVIESAGEKLSNDPNELAAYIQMGQAYELLDRPEEALMAYQRLLSIKPDSIEGLLAYAELLKKKGKLKMAMRCYREILKLKSDHIDARIHLVKANLSLGFLNEALRHAVMVQKLVPDDPRVHFLLGKIYFSKGLAPRALKEFSYVASHARDPDMISWAELMRRRLSRNY